MSSLGDMLWIELRKALRSRMPIWTALGSLFLPLAIAFLIFAAKNPAISQKLGLISAKANLMAYAATDWPSYLTLFSQLMATAGFAIFVFIISWIFGREFADGTVKDLLAVPTPRGSIVLAKYVVAALWSAAMELLIFAAGLAMGALLRLPAASEAVLAHGSAVALIAALLAICLSEPFALLASAGRGYLLPIGIAVLTLMATQVAIVVGWGEYFPWAIAGLYAQEKTALSPASFEIVIATGLAGVLATMLWWKYADYNR